MVQHSVCVLVSLSALQTWTAKGDHSPPWQVGKATGNGWAVKGESVAGEMDEFGRDPTMARERRMQQRRRASPFAHPHAADVSHP
jgi:hypothetical protein